MVVATANPEDYTNRGRLITPLKDRFGSQIRTHYPYELTTEIAIMHQEAKLAMAPVPITVPWFIDDIVARVSHVARKSHVISQSSAACRCVSRSRTTRSSSPNALRSDVAHPRRRRRAARE